MIIKHNLVKKQKARKTSSLVDIDVYHWAEELYDELEKQGVIQRVKDTNQLGVIRVAKHLTKSRYDYMLLQLYFHQLIRKDTALQSSLEYSYGNYVRPSEFHRELDYIDKQKITVGDLLQILTISYNIGHFYNTFVSSKAAVAFAGINPEFKRTIVESFDRTDGQSLAQHILEEKSYLRYHLLNSLLILERCDQSKISVRLAQDLIYTYVNEKNLAPDSKLCYVLRLYRNVRNIAFLSYDFQIAPTPITIDLCDSKSILLLFHELLSIYNDNSSTRRLLNSMNKLLNDTVYNEESSTICYQMITDRMVSELRQVSTWDKDIYYSMMGSKESIFNRDYAQSRRYVSDGFLKLTFRKEHREISRALFSRLNHMQYVRVGYYDRNSGEQTIVVSLSNQCKKKTQVAFRVLGVVTNLLRTVPNIMNNDPRYLLATKFYLFYLCGQRQIHIKPTVSSQNCVLCTKGKSQRILSINKVLRENEGDEDQVHEVEHLRWVLQKDAKNDVCITLPSSILVCGNGNEDKTFCEFDGMIIYPNRTSNQIVFLEAKNTKVKPTYGKKCLIDKLRKLNIQFEEEDIEINKKDAMLFWSV